MRIEKIIAKNFRQLRNVEIEFDKVGSFDLHLFIGQNGAGKSNIMNLINWCLYGDEPHLSAKSKALPIINLKTVEESDVNNTKTVDVEVWIQTENSKRVIFSRTATFKIVENISGATKFTPTLFESSFKVLTSDQKNNSQIIVDEEAESYVNRFVPKDIREFFFFDGERLDKYFIDATGEKISSATFMISQIDLLGTVERKLTTMTKDLSTEAGKNNPNLDVINTKINNLEQNIAANEKLINEVKSQISTSREIIKECSEYLEGLPDVESLEKRREQLKEDEKTKNEKRGEKSKKKQDIIMEYGKLIHLSSIIKSSIDIIQTKRVANELPPNIDPDLLREMLRDNKCKACYRKLDDFSTQKIKSVLEEISLSSQVAQELISIENPLKMLYENLRNYKNIIKEINDEISELDNDLNKIEKEKNEIDNKIDSLKNANKIREKHNERKQHESLLEKNQKTLWSYENQLEQEKQELVKEYEKQTKELQKNDLHIKLRSQIEFCHKAISVIQESKEIIMNETRSKIEKETKESFFNLVWKKNTFQDVKIDENYNINLIHRLGYECLGSVSAAERELLALSFTLALHKVSGFESPIIIDTPVARVSDTNRENFAKVLEEISGNKQTILLFTPDEYSDNIKATVNMNASAINIFLPQEDETETKIEVLV